MGHISKDGCDLCKDICHKLLAALVDLLDFAVAGNHFSHLQLVILQALLQLPPTGQIFAFNKILHSCDFSL